MRAIVQNFKGTTNFKSSNCPYEAGIYDIIDWEVSDNFLPKVLMAKDAKFVSIVTFLSQKELRGEFFRFNLYGETK